MQDDSIHWNGEPVAVVLAETQEQADHAASLIEVAYESSTPRTFEEARAHRAHARQSRRPAGRGSRRRCRGRTHRRAPFVDLTYRTPRHNHNAIEPHAVTLGWDGDELIVHDASQGVKLHAWTLAQVFGIDESQVHLTSPYVGGGFGGKTLWSHHVLGAAASKLAGRPCGSRSRARASTGWSAVARTPSSESRSAPMTTAASRRSSTPASPR
jgi:xanthine dehydrogenase YagR molybdenum-binding subunit